MATQESVLFYRWSSRCHQVISVAEDILATVGVAEAPPPAELERLAAETRNLIAESRCIGDGFDPHELKTIARNALEAAERLRAVIEKTPLPASHPLRELYEEFSDNAEIFALSVEPRTGIDLETALDEEISGEAVPWETSTGRCGKE